MVDRTIASAEQIFRRPLISHVFHSSLNCVLRRDRMQTYSPQSSRFSVLTAWTKNLPKPLQQLWKPMLLASVALHGLLLVIPMGEEKKPEPKKSEEPVKLTKLAGNPNAKPTPKPLQRRVQPQVQATPQRTLPRRTTAPTTLPPLVVNQTPKPTAPKQETPKQPAPEPRASTPPPPTPNQTTNPNTPNPNPPANSGPGAGAADGVKGDPDQIKDFVSAVRTAGFPAPASDGSTMEVNDDVQPDPADIPELFAGTARPADGGTLVVGNATIADAVPLIQNSFASGGLQMTEDAPIGNSRVFQAVNAGGQTRYVSFSEVKPSIGKSYVVVLIWKTKPGT